MKKKFNWKILILLTIPLFLAGCGNTKENNQTMAMFNKQNEKAQQQFGGQQQNVANKVSLYQGTPIISGNLITVPMIVQNDGQNPINYISNKVSLEIPVVHKTTVKKLFKTETKTTTDEYVITNNDPATYPSNFNLDMESKDMLQTFMTFKLTPSQFKKFTSADLQKARLIYQTPTGKKEKAVNIPSNTTASDMQDNLTSIQPTKLGQYYQNVAELMTKAAKEDHEESVEAQQAKEQNQQNQQSQQSSTSQSQASANSSSSSSDNPDDLMKNPMTENARKLMASDADNEYNDSHYTELNFKVIKLDSNHILLDFDNETSEPFVLPLNSFELTSPDQENIMVKASLTNYSIFIPSNKETEVVIPLSQKLGSGSYLPELKDTSDSSAKFNSTKHMINQIVYEGGE